MVKAFKLQIHMALIYFKDHFERKLLFYVFFLIAH